MNVDSDFACIYLLHLLLTTSTAISHADVAPTTYYLLLVLTTYYLLLVLTTYYDFACRRGTYYYLLHLLLTTTTSTAISHADVALTTTYCT